MNAKSQHGNDDIVIHTEGLTKRYGDIVAVDHVDLRLKRGEVYGFLGANGAGKTTTLRMLLGLIAPTSGQARVLGAAPGSAASLMRIGSMIETPAFYPHLTGRENLMVLARYAGVPRERVDLVLGQVDLATRSDDHFRTYSLGMKQRLGVAAALLKDPDLLILDEPTNGLDPIGMADMRSLIRELGTGHRTVLLSSHLMSEIEQICDRVGVIAKGRMVAEGTIDELRGETALLIRADPLEQAWRLVAGIGGVADVVIGDGVLRAKLAQEGVIDPARVNEHLVTEGIAVRELRWDRMSLESVFIGLNNGQEQETIPDGASTVAGSEREVAHV